MVHLVQEVAKDHHWCNDIVRVFANHDERLHGGGSF